MELPIATPTNRFLIRERDRHWPRVLTTVLVVASVLFLVLFLVGWPRLKATSIHYELIQLRSEVDGLENTANRLRLELERERSPQALAERAEALGLVVPPPSAVHPVEGR
jgi:hypothetical protein